mmetsp:Transcript_85897/g.184088  ORF Transcript_85897/g.184088 Transcript_85897/m.184088 type:complete len:250 (-) Transcript_85897:80-829(-)
MASSPTPVPATKTQEEQLRVRMQETASLALRRAAALVPSATSLRVPCPEAPAPKESSEEEDEKDDVEKGKPQSCSPGARCRTGSTDFPANSRADEDEADDASGNESTEMEQPQPESTALVSYLLRLLEEGRPPEVWELRNLHVRRPPLAETRSAAPRLAFGARVRVAHFPMEEMNGCVGSVRGYNEHSKRYSVDLTVAGGEVMSLRFRLENLETADRSPLEEWRALESEAALVMPPGTRLRACDRPCAG